MIAITTDQSFIAVAGQPANGFIELTPSVVFTYYEPTDSMWHICPSTPMRFEIVDGKFPTPVIVPPTSGAGQAGPVFYQVIFEIDAPSPARWTECWVIDANQGPSLDQSQVMRVNNRSAPAITPDVYTRPITPTNPMPVSAQGVYTTAEVIPGDRIVKVINNVAHIASCTDTDYASVLYGLSTHAADLGANLLVQHFGAVIEPSWSWDMTLPILLGLAGAPVQALPIGAVFALRIAWATSPNSIFMQLAAPVAL